MYDPSRLDVSLGSSFQQHVIGFYSPRELCVCVFFFFSSRRRHTRCSRDWSSDVCSSDLHLEGSLQPATVCALTARHGVKMTEEEVRRRYAYRDFPEFIEAFKWVTSFLREIGRASCRERV